MIDPATLTEGIYRIRLDVADDGVPVGTNTATAMVRVVATLPALSADNDADGDGLSDADEGYGDSDGDGIADYLDATSAANSVTMNEQGYMLEVQPGLKLRLGQHSFASGVAAVAEPSIQEESRYDYPDGVVDIDIQGLTPGGTGNIVIPLKFQLPAGAVYRKYISRIL